MFCRSFPSFANVSHAAHPSNRTAPNLRIASSADAAGLRCSARRERPKHKRSAAKRRRWPATGKASRGIDIDACVAPRAGAEHVIPRATCVFFTPPQRQRETRADWKSNKSITSDDLNSSAPVAFERRRQRKRYFTCPKGPRIAMRAHPSAPVPLIPLRLSASGCWRRQVFE